jgi:hypothetical protein
MSPIAYVKKWKPFVVRNIERTTSSSMENQILIQGETRMTYFYFVGFSAQPLVGKGVLNGNIEYSTETEITSMEQIQPIVDELSTQHGGEYKNFTVTGLYLLRKEEKSNS